MEREGVVVTFSLHVPWSLFCPLSLSFEGTSDHELVDGESDGGGIECETRRGFVRSINTKLQNEGFRVNPRVESH